MVVGRKAFSRETASLPGLDVGARTHSKIAVAEVSGIEIHWAAPRDLLVTEMVFAISAERGPCIGSNHIGGANALLSSGEVVFLSQSLNAQDLRAMVGAEKDATAE
jgi:hypothetical protein